MRIAIIGSRNLKLYDLDNYIPKGVTEIVSGGAVGIDSCAKKYALEKGLRLTEYLPNYKKYGVTAPLFRNMQIIENCDLVLAFWDGKSKGTRHVIKKCTEQRIPVKIYLISQADD